LNEWLNNIEKVDSLTDLEKIRVAILGKKGFLSDEFKKLKDFFDSLIYVR